MKPRIIKDEPGEVDTQDNTVKPRIIEDEPDQRERVETQDNTEKPGIKDTNILDDNGNPVVFGQFDNVTSHDEHSDDWLDDDSQDDDNDDIQDDQISASELLRRSNINPSQIMITTKRDIPPISNKLSSQNLREVSSDVKEDQPAKFRSINSIVYGDFFSSDKFFSSRIEVTMRPNHQDHVINGPLLHSGDDKSRTFARSEVMFRAPAGRGSSVSLNKHSNPSRGLFNDFQDFRSSHPNVSIGAETITDDMKESISRPKPSSPSSAHLNLESAEQYHRGEVFRTNLARDQLELQGIMNLNSIDCDSLASRIVFFLNKRQDGAVIFGVDDDMMMVIGVKMSRSEKDLMRQLLDRICRDSIEPSVSPRNVDIEFIPVKLPPGQGGHHYIVKISVIITPGLQLCGPVFKVVRRSRKACVDKRRVHQRVHF